MLSHTTDCRLTRLINEIADQRPTYGYRRICALLNRKLDADGSPLVNHKRVYRLMKTNDLLLERSGRDYCQRRLHTGSVITEKSDQRWCGDGFELRCANGEKVRRELYRKRGIIENMFVRIKDWRGIAMRYWRCAHTFDSFICLALITIFFDVR